MGVGTEFAAEGMRSELVCIPAGRIKDGEDATGCQHELFESHREGRVLGTGSVQRARTPHSEGISRWYGSPVFQGSDCDVCATLGAAAEVCGAGQIHRCLGQGVQCLTGFRWWHQHDAQRPSFCPLPRRRLAGVVPVQHCLLAESLQDADMHGRWSLSAVTGWLQ